MQDTSLTHWGIKGMKWGVRRYQNKDGSLTAAGKKRYSSESVHEDYAKAHDSKSVKSMSDAELRNRLNRLNMERQYAQLSPAKTNKGKEAVSKIMKTATAVAGATTTAITLYNNFDKIKKIIEKMAK